jgi:hypothetical protein
MSDDPNVFEAESWDRDMGARGSRLGPPAAVAEQLDPGTILAMTAQGDGWAFPTGADADYVALTLAAIEADK